MLTITYCELLNLKKQHEAQIKALRARHITLVHELSECRDYIDKLEYELDGEDDESDWD